MAQTHRKLCEALERLIQIGSDPALRSDRDRFSVARLAREAGVARNAIYTNHRAIIDALRQAAAQQLVPQRLDTWEDKLAQQRAVIDMLSKQQRLLATENAALLKRAMEAESTAARYQKLNARLLQERDAVRKPVALVPRGAK
ncbi:hypothetical protein APY03_3725 [Variovorax sp. WDL1]|nr:hypothetical protein APY03_3725 [Variovorax sp. WDL1]